MSKRLKEIVVYVGLFAGVVSIAYLTGFIEVGADSLPVLIGIFLGGGAGILLTGRMRDRSKRK